MKKITSFHQFIAKKVLITAILISFNIKSHAQAISIASGNWSNAAIWNTGFPPTAGQFVVINNFVYYDLPVSINSGASITINQGATLCGTSTFTVTCGSYFTCNGLMSGVDINVTDGVIGNTGWVYAANSFSSLPCSSGFFGNNQITVGLPFSCSPTGINENNFNGELRISPNPFFNNLNISCKTNKTLEIILFDIASRKLLQQQFSNSVSLNTASLAKGIYLYEIKDKSDVIKKGKVIKE